MDEMNIEQMSLEEVQRAIEETKTRLEAEGLSQEERAQLEELLQRLESRLDEMTTRAERAAREAAGLGPAA